MVLTIRARIMTSKTGQTFKKARLNMHLTQAQLAKKAAINVNTYAKIERGEQTPSFLTAKKLAKALDLNLSDIPD